MTDQTQGPPEAQRAHSAPTARNAPMWEGQKPITCPECGELFYPRAYQQVFCSTPHKKAFQNRAAVDGRAIIALAKAWRLSRNAKKDSPNRATGQAAFRQLVTTLDNMLERDRDEGRKPQMAFDYVRSLFTDGRDWRDRATTSTWGRREREERPKPEPKAPEVDPIKAALEAIANGHNDPRALAAAILAGQTEA
jgi:hypothetical protein